MQDVDPAVWGGDAWRFLHTIANAYPADPDTATRRGMFELLNSLTVVLPCTQCRLHLSEFMVKSGVRSSESAPFLSGTALRAFVDQAHTNANQQRDERLKKDAPAPLVAVAAGASVVSRSQMVQGAAVTERPAAHGPTLDSMFATDAITRTDEKRRRGLAISFYIIAPVLLGMFVAFVVVTWRRR
jgi:hypothetical protein